MANFNESTPYAGIPIMVANDVINRTSISPDEIHQLKIELASVKNQLSSFRHIFSEILGLFHEMKGELGNSLRDSTDSGMMSSDQLNRMKEERTEHQEVVPQAPETIQPFYGFIKHNPNKTLKRKQEEVEEIPIETTLESEPVYIHKKIRAAKKVDTNKNSEDYMIPIGTGSTFVSKHVYNNINWHSYTIATRRLLMACFSRKQLATHSLTGKPSPAFVDKPPKFLLDPKTVSDIIITVTEKCNVKENLVRTAITSKCADENKMMRNRKHRVNKTA